MLNGRTFRVRTTPTANQALLDYRTPKVGETVGGRFHLILPPNVSGR